MEDLEPQEITTSQTSIFTSNRYVDPASFNQIGIDIEIAYDEETLELSNRRIQVISGLERCTRLKSLILVSNFISKIQNISHLTKLTELELYQNKIKSIQGLNMLTNLRVLDLSFNEIRKIENLESLVNIEKLYLSSNKISKIEGLQNLQKLKLLELGSNRIRGIEGLHHLNSLEELWLGKNKINNGIIPSLPNLKIISLQSNRLINWDEIMLLNCPNLVQIYLSNNAIKTVPSVVTSMKELNVLDLSSNLISSLEYLDSLTSLEELWINDNSIEDPQELQKLNSLKNLKTIYLERNPIQTNLGPGYRSAIMTYLPWIEQVDAKVLNPKNSFHEIKFEGTSSLKK